MRYPGPHQHERLTRQLIFGMALIIFLIGLAAANHKDRPDTQSIDQKPTSSPAPATTPLAVNQTTAVLRLLDEKTKKPLAGQSVAVITLPDCVVASVCPTSSPLIVTADSTGRISLPTVIVRARPKLYAAGYKLDSYFSFLDQQKPSFLTVYKPVEGTKASFDISIEEAIIGLTPTK